MSERAPKFLKEFSKETGADARKAKAAEIWAARREGRDRRSSIEVEGLEEVRKNIAHLESTLREQQGKDMLMDFYEAEQARWEKSEVNFDVIDRYFSAEYLKELPLNEYIALLRRFPQEMVTHVSRRGIRDHQMLEEHDTGVGEFHDSFDQVLIAKNLQSAIGRELEQESKNAYVERELGLRESDTREEAEEKLQKVVSHEGWASFSDFSAVHFAAEDVADDYYGAERGNEHFIVFPSALIAAEYDFGGHYADLSKPNDDKTRNDVWVWAKEEQGIPIDAGIVFLPKDSRVNPDTGSRYELTDDKKPIVDQELVGVVDALHSNESFNSMLVEAEQADYALQDKVRADIRSEFGDYKTFDKRYAAASLLQRNEIIARMEKEFGVTDRRLQQALMSYHGTKLMSIPERKNDYYDHYAFSRNRVLMNAGIYYKEAKQTVPAEEFWGEYFKAHPDRKPSKVVYYEGGDPMKALQKWRHDNGIVRTSQEVGVDFKSRSRKVSGSPESAGTRSRFESIGREVINEHFAKQEAPPIVDTEK